MQNGRHERAQEQNNFFFLRRFQHDESVRVVFFLAFVFNYSMAMAVGGAVVVIILLLWEIRNGGIHEPTNMAQKNLFEISGNRLKCGQDSMKEKKEKKNAAAATTVPTSTQIMHVFSPPRVTMASNAKLTSPRATSSHTFFSLFSALVRPFVRSLFLYSNSNSHN